MATNEEIEDLISEAKKNWDIGGDFVLDMVKVIEELMKQKDTIAKVKSDNPKPA